MYALSGLLPWLRPAELRIDVARPEPELHADLTDIYRRLHTPGDALHGIRTLPSGLPDLVFRCREADGEYFVYVEDVRHRRLAGYTVFNRLIELNRRAEKHARSPHSAFAAEYRRRGIATAIYRSALDSGLCLVSGARQSPGAHALWQRLAAHHPLGFVDIGRRSLRWLGTDVDKSRLDDLDTRMILLGRNWRVDRLDR